MLDLKFVRENIAIVEEALRKRRSSLTLDGFVELDKARRERLVEVEGPAVGSPASTLDRWRDARRGLPQVFVGDGAVLYAAEIALAAPAAAVRPAPLLAGAIARLAVSRTSEALDPAAIRPLYVRRTDVEMKRDENVFATGANPKDT